MSGRELNLDGAETSVIKAIGLSGSEISGEDLISRCSDIMSAELVDTLKGLMMVGYVVADRANFHSIEEIKPIGFRVNSGYTKDLREALDPQRAKPKSKRVRRE
ncbi:MAG TPA: hypothetical protein VF593_02585 [Chthoniobacteraceae bacterium]|jgi:hypothetical protein